MKIEVGTIYNNESVLKRVLLQSQIDSGIPLHIVKNPISASKGLNTLLDKMKQNKVDVGVLVHQDIYLPKGWMNQLVQQLSLLPKSWVVAGVFGKNEKEEYCGKIYDRRIPNAFFTPHKLPMKSLCIDECCIIVNLKKGFRFDEKLKYFDLYGTYAVLKGRQLGTSWIIECPPEHYSQRPFEWKPNDNFMGMIKYLEKKFPKEKILSTVL